MAQSQTPTQALTWRQKTVSRPLMKWVSSILPEMSDTEAQAIEAGTIWFERELASGNPDWNYLKSLPKPALNDEERAFVEGPVQDLCSRLDDWEIERERGDLPPEVWEFLIREGFFAMIIPKDYGGKGFSAYAHSEIVRTIATRSITAAVTVMVPNSLGPGELLMLYGTKEQQDYYLPRLAKGDDIPCFALTGVEAGSDASSMTDRGIICEREVNGERVLGAEITCDKRYITLAPVATIAGLAVNLEDPDGLLGDQTDLGITVFLVPTDTPGFETGRRHLPSGLAFQNGPVRADKAFVPLSRILGGEEQIGQGWKMLMGALAAGRGISLPSLSAAGISFAAHTSGAYAAIRRQFGLPIGSFEGVREPLARIAANAYLVDGARRLTTVGIDSGEKPAVVSAIMKYHATERLRQAINDAFDIHGGKAICEGPKNYLATSYRAIPIGITVEGANIVTRSLIIFGQGAVRCHPHIFKEMKAVQSDDVASFDDELFAHAGYMLKTAGRSFGRNLGGTVNFERADLQETTKIYAELARASAALAASTEIALVTLGGALKRKEALNARLGDILSELYLLTGAVKRFEDESRPVEDEPLLRYCLVDGFARIDRLLDEVIRAFPNKLWAGVMRLIAQPLGARRRGVSDKLINEVATLVQQKGPARDRLGDGVYAGTNSPIAELEAVFADAERFHTLEDRLRKKDDLTDAERQDLTRLRERVRRIIEVDDFTPDRLARREAA